MARGFLSGIIAGLAVSGLGLGALSLSSEVPGMAPPEASAEVAAPAPAPALETSVPEPSGAQPAETAPDDGLLVTAPETRAPEPEESSGFSGVDTSPAERPETGEASGALSAPDTGSNAPEVSAEADAPVMPENPSAALEAPAEEPAPDVATQTAEPRPEAPKPAPQPVESAEGADAPEAQDEAPALPAPLPDEEREEITLEIPSAEEGDVPAQPAAEAADGAEETARVSIGTPAKTLGSSQSSRLPSLAQDAAESAESNEAPAAATVNIADLPPIERFAAPFVPEGDAPLMAIVLIDDGTSNIGVEALSTFPYPLSFAVDTSWEGAADAMAIYRAQEFEVLAMVGMPQGARARDVEVNLPVLMEAVPEAVALMETPDAALQASRDVVQQVAAIASDTGHGLLLFPKGLNTAQKLAAKEGVPSATVFRDFDGNGQNASAIKRFLNHAALKSQSEGGVVMVGRLRADTISALLLWGLQDRGGRVQLAPVSQLLKTAE